jgi:hypothetical protein
MENSMLRPVIIISPGRSGSTLLQRYLNTSDGLIVWGEHGGFIRGLSKVYLNLKNNQHLQNMLTQGRKNAGLLLRSETPVQVDIEWTNNFTIEDVRKAFQKSILDILTIDVPPSVRWGFKEIRYGEPEIAFLKELFPEAQFIFVVRHPIDTLASMIAAWAHKSDIFEKKTWQEDKSKLEEIQRLIATHSGHMLLIAESIKNCRLNGMGILVRYDDLKDDPSTIIRNLCSYLDVSSPPEDKIQMIASDYRWAMSTGSIKEALYNDFKDNENIQKIISLYEFFEYNVNKAT